jgi:uncharacterized membrane protein
MLLERTMLESEDVQPGSSGPGTLPARAVAENVARIVDLERAARRELAASERLSQAITDLAGSLRFVVAHLLLFGGWALWNTMAPSRLRWDPFPFGLMTMLVSLEGVLLAVFVLITQNRILSQTDRRDHLELQVSILAEQELTMALRMLRQLCDRAGIQPESDREVQDLMGETNVHELMRQIENELPAE